MPEMRAGVRLTPLKARIFDLVESRPGVTQSELADVLGVARATAAAHIWQINDVISEHGYRLKGASYCGYRLVRVATE